MTLQEGMRHFLEHLEVERGRSRFTIRDYHHYLQTFNDFAAAENMTDCRDITQELVFRYRLWLNQPRQHATRRDYQSRSKKTQNYYLIALRSFLKWLATRDIATLSPEKITLASVEEREITFLEPEEIERILAKVDPSAPQGRRDRAILELLFSTGLRISELTHLDRDDINLESNEFSVLGKRGKVRIVFLSPQAGESLAKYLQTRRDDDPALFVRTQENQHGDSAESKTDNPALKHDSAASLRLTPRSVQRLVQKYAKEAGLGKRVTPHVFRHTFATDLLSNGADLRSVQELLGHSSVTTTQIYTHVTNPQLAEVHRAFHARQRQSKTSDTRCADAAPTAAGSPDDV